MGFSYTVSKEGTKAIVALVGDADMSCVDTIKSIFEEALQLSSDIIIDASATTMINSTCFGVINIYHQQAKKAGGSLVFAALNNSRVKKVFNVMGWGNIIKVYDTVKEAADA